MQVVLGASGNTGHIVAQNLLARQQKVRVVGRNAAHLQAHAAKGAEIFIADVTDAAALTKAFQNADAAYVMIPPNPTSNDPLAYSERVGDAIAAALKSAGVKNVVALSSIGADKSQGTGPVIGLYKLEQKLNQLGRQRTLSARRLLHGKHAAASPCHFEDGLCRWPNSPGPQTSPDRNPRHRSLCL